MGVDPNWALLGQAPNIGQSFEQGMAMGRQQAIQARHDNALAAVQKNPNDPNALGTLAIYNPQAANAVIQMKTIQRQEAQRQAIASSVKPDGSVDWDKAVTTVAAKDPAAAYELRQKAIAAQQAQQTAQDDIMKSAVRGLAVAHDDPSWQQATAEFNATRVKHGLPAMTFPPTYNKDLADRLRERFGMSASEQLTYEAPDYLDMSAGKAYASKDDPTKIITASPIPHIIAGANGAFYQQDPYKVASDPESDTQPTSATAPAVSGHVIGTTLPPGSTVDAPPVQGGPSRRGSGTFPGPVGAPRRKADQRTPHRRG